MAGLHQLQGPYRRGERQAGVGEKDPGGKNKRSERNA